MSNAICYVSVIDYLDFLKCLNGISDYTIEDYGITLKYMLNNKLKERTIYFDVENGNKYEFFEKILENAEKIKDEEEQEIFEDIIRLYRTGLINELQKKIDNTEEQLKVCGFDKELTSILYYYKEVLSYYNKSGELDLPLKYKE